MIISLKSIGIANAIIIASLLLIPEISAQWSHDFEQGIIPVVIDGDTLQNPWVGGLTAPQWSPIDFDFDSDEDLFAFDRDGSRLLAFERTDSGWKYRPEWVQGWPDIVDWCLLRDYDCDGRPDIFTSYQNGIYVYRNLTEDPNNPQFEPVATPLMASYGLSTVPNPPPPDILPVFCLGIDIPAILDHDGDGDLDIISFTENSSTLYRYHGDTECGLQMTCTNRCYGMLAEASENNALFIGDDFNCSFNVADPREAMHAGGSITSLQLDNSGPLDLIIGDVSFPLSLAILMEDAVDGQDSAIFIDQSFPLLTGGTEALSCQRFPASYHIDIDEDGIRDLLFSPNTYLETDDDASVHYLKNTGEDLSPTWEYIQNDFIQEGMIDLGRGSYPVLIDLDSDGLVDLVLANKEQYQGVDNTPTSILLFKNTGTLSSPVFSHQWQDTVDISTYGIESAFPALGDLDGDGDLDLIVGDEFGLMHSFENYAGEGNWPEFVVSELSISASSTISNNYSMSFDGNNDIISINATNFNDIDDISVCFWLQTNSNSYSRIINKDCVNCPEGEWKVDMQGINNGKILFEIESGSGGVSSSLNSITSVNDGNYHFIVCSRNNQTGETKLYVDGQLEDSDISNDNIYTITNNYPLYFGGILSGDNNYLGRLDNIHIWNTALTQQEIQTYMSCPPTGNESGLVGYWNFEEGSGNTVLDLTPNGNDGTINGATYDTNVIAQSCEEVIDIGQFAAPQLIDIDSDGLLDLVVGEKNGTLTLFLNCGDNVTPSWCKVESEAFGGDWGDIHVTNILGINGYSTPALYEDTLGIHVLVANETGTVQYFGLVNGDYEIALEEVNSEVIANGEGGTGLRSGATFADLNGDSIVDCLIGIQNGGVKCYISSDSSTTNITNITSGPVYQSLMVFPNPGQDILNWQLGASSSMLISQSQMIIEVRNELGQIIFTSPPNGGSISGSISTNNWPGGVYIISLIELGTKKGGLLGPPIRWVKLY